MYTIDKIEKRIDKIFEVHQHKIELACDEAHPPHTILRNCFRADDPNELIICELCELTWILLGRLKRIKEETE